MSEFLCCRSDCSDLTSSSLSCSTEVSLNRRSELTLVCSECLQHHCLIKDSVGVGGWGGRLLVMLQLQSFLVLPQSVVHFGDRDVGNLKLLQQTFSFIKSE